MALRADRGAPAGWEWGMETGTLSPMSRCRHCPPEEGFGPEALLGSGLVLLVLVALSFQVPRGLGCWAEIGF